jgi:hypothetical protein
MKRIASFEPAWSVVLCVSSAWSGTGCSVSSSGLSSDEVLRDAGRDGNESRGDAGGAEAGVANGTPATFNVFDEIPQFGLYATTDPPDYAPPPGVVMWSYGTVFVTQLSAPQKSEIGSDLAARVTYFAECDNYDRLGGVFFLIEPKGRTPLPTDLRTEIVRFITPFSDFTQGALATHAYPDADISDYARALADTTHDVWIGLAGGSNPYGGDPCAALDAGADFSAVGFKYSVDFVSTKPLTLRAGLALTAISDQMEMTVPITATFTNPGGPIAGKVTVIVSGHGSAAGGDEYEYTMDELSVNGAQVGSFSTEIDCSSYRVYSPDGNPFLFDGNTTDNPRNWCPGALVPSHTFPVSLKSGTNTVGLSIDPLAVPSGSYYATSINFTSP